MIWSTGWLFRDPPELIREAETTTCCGRDRRRHHILGDREPDCNYTRVIGQRLLSAVFATSAGTVGVSPKLRHRVRDAKTETQPGFREGLPASATTPGPRRKSHFLQQKFLASTGDGIDHPRRTDRAHHLIGGVLDPRSIGGVLAESDERHCRDDNQGEDPDNDAHLVTVSNANLAWAQKMRRSLDSDDGRSRFHTHRSGWLGMDAICPPGNGPSPCVSPGGLVTLLQRPAGQPGLTV